ncbi:hypothetical protein LCGC14_2608590 [marine sediment metagenome]|uniref:Uncharacterized protein n=1 Tax=marine sediment metagenome TaxID=412755 RepID=A0A0F9AU70_9ZZZZ
MSVGTKLLADKLVDAALVVELILSKIRECEHAWSEKLPEFGEYAGQYVVIQYRTCIKCGLEHRHIQHSPSDSFGNYTTF